MQCRFWSSPPSTPPSGSPCRSPLTATLLFVTHCATTRSLIQPAHEGWYSLCTLGVFSLQPHIIGGLSCGTAFQGWVVVVEGRVTEELWLNMSWCGPTVPLSTSSLAASSSPSMLLSCASYADAAVVSVYVATLLARPPPFSLPSPPFLLCYGLHAPSWSSTTSTPLLQLHKVLAGCSTCSQIWRTCWHCSTPVSTSFSTVSSASASGAWRLMCCEHWSIAESSRHHSMPATISLSQAVPGFHQPTPTASRCWYISMTKTESPSVFPLESSGTSICPLKHWGTCWGFVSLATSFAHMGLSEAWKCQHTQWEQRWQFS